MRIWHPISVTELDNKRLLAEHNESLIIARAIRATKLDIKYGYKHHPETKRFFGHTKALAHRHHLLAQEMVNRGFNHRSPWPDDLIDPNDPEQYPLTLVEPYETMVNKLEMKKRGLK